MPPAGPAPLFHGRAVPIDYGPSVRNPRIVHALMTGIVGYCEDKRLTEDELIERLLIRIARHEGLIGKLVGRTPLAIEISVTGE